MRKLICPLIIFLVASCTGKNLIEGTWEPIQQEMGGTELPRSAFVNSLMTINGDHYVVSAEQNDKGDLHFEGNQITITGKEGPNAGREFKAIYKIENGLLTICYNLAGDTFPEDFETLGNPLYLKSVFKRSQ